MLCADVPMLCDAWLLLLLGPLLLLFPVLSLLLFLLKLR
jgi:hypothetical protein